MQRLSFLTAMWITVCILCIFFPAEGRLTFKPIDNQTGMGIVKQDKALEAARVNASVLQKRLQNEKESKANKVLQDWHDFQTRECIRLRSDAVFKKLEVRRKNQVKTIAVKTPLNPRQQRSPANPVARTRPEQFRHSNRLMELESADVLMNTRSSNDNLYLAKTTAVLPSTSSANGYISGHIYDQQTGLPISGAAVHAEIDLWNPLRIEAITDANGKYAIPVECNTGYVIHFHSPDLNYIQEYYNDVDIRYTWSASRITVNVPGDTVKNIDFTVAHGGWISGQVTDASGNPISGAWVLASMVYVEDYWETGVYSQADGRFQLLGLPQATYFVYAEKRTYAREYYDNKSDGWTAVSVITEQETPYINFSLDPCGYISGLITDSFGQPVANPVYISTSSHGEYTEFLPGNRYMIGGLASGQYRVHAEATGYVLEYYDNTPNFDSATLVTVSAPDTTADINFSLAELGKITGHVTDETGNPLSGAIVTCYWLDEDYVTKGATDTTGTDGEYQFLYLWAGSYLIEAEKDDYVSEYYNNAYDEEGATHIPVVNEQIVSGIDLALQSSGSLSGRFYDIHGNPIISGLSAAAYNTDLETYMGNMQPFADGSYAVTGLLPGHYKIQGSATNFYSEWYNDAQDLDYATEVIITAEETTGNIDFTLDKAGSISGWVTDADGNPLQNIWVSMFIPGSGYYPGGASTQADGSYKLENLTAGHYIVLADGYSYVRQYYCNSYSVDQTTLVDVQANKETSAINFVLQLAGAIQGEVTFASGGTDYLDGAAYNIDRGVWMGGFGFDGYYYSITGLLPGRYKVRVGGHGVQYEWYDNVTDMDQATEVVVSAQQTTSPIDFQLGKAGRITGRVTDASEQPIYYARVYAADFDENFPVANTVTNFSGSFELSGLGTGDYRVYAEKSSMARKYYNNVYDPMSASRVGVVQDQNTSGIDITLEAAGGIRGQVTDAAGNPMPNNINVAAYNTDYGLWMGYLYTGNTEGKYWIDQLLPGHYSIYCQMAGYIPEWYDNVSGQALATAITVTAGQDVADVDFSLTNMAGLSLKLYLAGAYSVADHNMKTTLLQNGSLPFVSPYAEDPCPVTMLPPETVDWILVELRKDPDGAAIASCSAFLRQDGIVTDSTGTEQLYLNVADDDYYITVAHRNHIRVMSSTALTLTAGAIAVYDFTTALEKYWGLEAAFLETDVYGLFKGDANLTGDVNASDYLTVKPKIGQVGYFNADVNMTGDVNASDYLSIKPNIGRASNVP